MKFHLSPLEMEFMHPRAGLKAQHLLFGGAISCWHNTHGYDGKNEGYPITSEEQVEGPDGGVKHLEHRAEQLQTFH